MARLSRALALLSIFGGTLLVARAIDPSSRSLNAIRREYSARGRNGAGDFRRATDTSPPSRVKNITFTNPKASGAYTSFHALYHLLISHTSRVLREWRGHTPSRL